MSTLCIERSPKCLVNQLTSGNVIRQFILGLTMAFAAAAWIAPPVLAVEPAPTPPPPSDNQPLLRLDDGKVFIGGSTMLDSGKPLSQAFAVWKRNADGSPDLSFNGEGFAVVPIWGYSEGVKSFAVQSDGRVVVAGYAWDPICPYSCEDRIAIVRFNSDGTLDRSFNGDGRLAIITAINRPIFGSDESQVSFSRNDVVILSDGTIQINNGELEPRVRVRPDGTLEGAIGSAFGLPVIARESPLVQAQGLWYNAPANRKPAGPSVSHSRARSSSRRGSPTMRTVERGGSRRAWCAPARASIAARFSRRAALHLTRRRSTPTR